MIYQKRYWNYKNSEWFEIRRESVVDNLHHRAAPPDSMDEIDRGETIRVGDAEWRAVKEMPTSDPFNVFPTNGYWEIDGKPVSAEEAEHGLNPKAKWKTVK